jgi:hypothetical protein
MEIVKINFVVGFHNGWMMLTDLPNFVSGGVGSAGGGMGGK